MFFGIPIEFVLCFAHIFSLLDWRVSNSVSFFLNGINGSLHSFKVLLVHERDLTVGHVFQENLCS